MTKKIGHTRIPGLDCRCYSADEAAILLGVDRSTVYREAKLSNTIAGVPVVRVGRRVLVSRDALHAAIRGEWKTRAA